MTAVRSVWFSIAICVALLLDSAHSLTEYSRLCDSVFCRIVEKSNSQIGDLKKLVDGGACIPQFGSKADEICNLALEEFALEAPLPEDSDEECESLHDKKVEELERVLDAPLQVLYYRQLSLLKEKALRTFKQSMSSTSDGTEFEAMMVADDLFRREALDATRQSPDWSFGKEASVLKSSLVEVAAKGKKLTEAKLTAAKQNQQAMDYLRSQQQQLQAMQQQLFGQSSPWNCAMAYRVPDTNVNLQASYQQGRGNIQISCVPDESVSLLGPNGFVHGVTPGNVGLSFNINI